MVCIQKAATAYRVNLKMAASCVFAYYVVTHSKCLVFFILEGAGAYGPIFLAHLDRFYM